MVHDIIVRMNAASRARLDLEASHPNLGTVNQPGRPDARIGFTGRGACAAAGRPTSTAITIPNAVMYRRMCPPPESSHCPALCRKGVWETGYTVRPFCRTFDIDVALEGPHLTPVFLPEG